MPTNKNAMTRYAVLDKLLSNRQHCYTIGDMLEKVNESLRELGVGEVGRRCIEKDIAYLKQEGSPFMCEIESYTVHDGHTGAAKRCLRYADPSFSIFTPKLSDEEKYLLRQVLTFLGQFDGLSDLAELERLRKSLNPRDGHQCGDMREIVSFTKNPLEKSNHFGEIFTAIEHKQVIELHFHTFEEKDRECILRFHPYLLKEYNRRWYVFGVADSDGETLNCKECRCFCPLSGRSARDGKILNFSLDRVDAVKPLPMLAYKEYDGQLDEWFDDIIGVTRYEGRPVQHILFWVSDMSKDYVATKPLHESQKPHRGQTEVSLRKQYPKLHGGAFFSIDCIENYELMRELTSFGSALVVLSPDSLREKITARISEMDTMYQKVRT